MSKASLLQHLTSQVVMHISRGCLVVPIHIELYDDVLAQIQASTLETLKSRSLKAVIFDLTAIEVMDRRGARFFSESAKLAALMGAKTFIVGIQPGLASALTDLGVTFEDIPKARDQDGAFELLAGQMAWERDGLPR